ncbi:MAG: aldo/keto reductase [Gammaproteobacteria bacterium]|jgi:diketogulonate reductase-like aldo/keto reductase
MGIFDQKIKRRQFIKAITAAGLAAPLFGSPLLAKSTTAIRKAIPSTGELLPVIGMGSSRTFDVGDDPEARKPLLDVLQAFFDNGGALIDSSPMYGSSEQVIGDLLKQVHNKDALFSATKVWIDGKEEGISQMENSMKLWGVNKFDLMQIHNLRDWETHLQTLKQWKSAGKVRYIGITTSHGRFHDELETILENEPFEFVQLSYNIGNRDVERHLLPIAREKGMAVLINRPYQRGSLFRKVKGHKLPDWAKEFDCNSWGQFFLKFVASHPAVTCVIPATSNPRHMIDNMQAGFGKLPDASTRKKMLAYFNSL